MEEKGIIILGFRHPFADNVCSKFDPIVLAKCKEFITSGFTACYFTLMHGNKLQDIHSRGQPKLVDAWPNTLLCLLTSGMRFLLQKIQSGIELSL